MAQSDTDDSGTNLVTGLKHYLTHVRRYARIVTGSAMHADIFLARALREMHDSPSLRLEGLQAEHALYRAVQRQIGADPDCVVDVNDIALPDHGAPPSAREAEIQARVNGLPIGRRSALALAAVDGFDVAEVAYILDSTTELAATLVIEAFEALGGWAGRAAGVLTSAPDVDGDILTMLSAMGLEHVFLDDPTLSDLVRSRIAMFVVEDDADPERLHQSNMGARLTGVQGDSKAPVIYVTPAEDDRTVALSSQRVFFVGRPLGRAPVVSIFRQALANGLAHAA